MSSFWFANVHSITISVTACATLCQTTYPSSFVLISSWSDVQCWRSKCQMWAVPSLLPETKRSPWLAHWMLSTRSEWASFSRIRCGPSSPTIRYTLQDKRCLFEINKAQKHSYHFTNNNNNIHCNTTLYEQNKLYSSVTQVSVLAYNEAAVRLFW